MFYAMCSPNRTLEEPKNKDKDKGKGKVAVLN
jgi:hypothetical protein